jgi:Mn2+/Fe2+ NRAMP family transporter
VLLGALVRNDHRRQRYRYGGFNFLGINPITALFRTSVLNGFLAPPLLVLVMLLANDRRVMGKLTNGRWLTGLGWAATIAMFPAVVGLVDHIGSVLTTRRAGKLA